ncbi:MAG: peptide ABC transporter substrate-binding protein [Alphaproteobacteria bacterium]|nr:peptide ABC transporter substrate-binding protein [Alphaproteobacteria bacterium]
MRRLRQFIFILVAAVAAVAGAPRAEAAKDELVIGITQFPANFNPLIEAMLAKSYILAMATRPITSFDKDWALVCLLCTTLPTIENGLAEIEDLPPDHEGPYKKGVALTVSLHPEARWGDGTPVTSADVVFTWEVGRHPQSGVGNVEGFRRILRIDVQDDKTFTLHVDRLTFDYNSLNGLWLLPAHLEREAFRDPIEYRNRTTFDTDTTNPGLYFGPYRITAVESGSHVVLEPNPTWYGPKPHFKRIVVRAITNTAALEANLRSGAIDYVAGELGLTLDQALAFEKRNRAAFTFLYKAGLVYEHIDLNLDNPILKDRRVRQALLYGIDRETLVAQLFAGRQPVAHSSVNPLDWVVADDIPKYAHDPARAKALLDAAGWSRIEGGVRHNGQGERLALTLMTTAGNRARELVQQVLQSQWRKLGIDVRVRNEPARVFFGQTVSQRRFPAMAMFAWISSPESVPRTTLHSTMIPTQENNFAGQNYTGFKNAQVDALIDQIEVELDRAKRKQLWAELQRIYATELPALPLFFRANPYILPSWLKGVEPTGHQFPSTLRVEAWRAAP